MSLADESRDAIQSRAVDELMTTVCMEEQPAVASLIPSCTYGRQIDIRAFTHWV